MPYQSHSDDCRGWWKSRTGLEQKLLILSTLLFILSFGLTISVIVLKNKTCPVCPEISTTTEPSTGSPETSTGSPETSTGSPETSTGSSETSIGTSPDEPITGDTSPDTTVPDATTVPEGTTEKEPSTVSDPTASTSPAA